MGLFDPNRWPKPYPMLTSWKRVAVGSLVLVAVVVAFSSSFRQSPTNGLYASEKKDNAVRRRGR
jgi:hypothetical protein